MKASLLLPCCGVMIALAGGCNGRESEPSPHVADVATPGRPHLEVSLSDGDLVVTLDNRSNEVVTIVDEPIIGFGLTGPRIGLVVQKDGREVLPCVHLDPPLREDPATLLPPGKSEVRKISLQVMKRAYCLEAMSYSVHAIYPADSRFPASSAVVSVAFESGPRASSISTGEQSL